MELGERRGSEQFPSRFVGDVRAGRANLTRSFGPYRRRREPSITTGPVIRAMARSQPLLAGRAPAALHDVGGAIDCVRVLDRRAAKLHHDRERRFPSSTADSGQGDQTRSDNDVCARKATCRFIPDILGLSTARH